MKKLVFAFLLLTGMLSLLSFSATASAYTCGKDVNGKDIVTSVDFGKLCNAKGASPLTAILIWIVNFLAVGVGIAVVVGISIGGLMYITSDGDASKAKQGREIIQNAIIGLLLFIFMYALANFFVPGGLFKA